MMLIFSNGFGETEIAKNISTRLLPKVNVKLYPFFGDVTNVDPNVLGFIPKNPGSGGFTTKSLSNFFIDILSGSTIELIRYIRSIRCAPKSNKILIIGDPFLLILVKLNLPFPSKTVFMSIYKSEVSEKHYWFEKYFIKKNVDYFLPRDKYTEEVFREYGVNSVYLGNPMVDSVEINGIDFRKDPQLKTLLILPGSKYFAYTSIVKMLYVVESVFEKYGFFNVLWPISNSLELEKIEAILLKHGWITVKMDEKILFKKNLVEIVGAYGAFGDMLNVSDVVFSVTGTATEQAAAFGKPTVMFYDPSMRVGKRWFNRQRLLLGDNLKLFDRFSISDISDEIIMLFLDERERNRRGEVGVKMIEGRGSIERISQFLLSI